MAEGVCGSEQAEKTVSSGRRCAVPFVGKTGFEKVEQGLLYGKFI